MSLPLTGYTGALAGPQSHEVFSWALLILAAASEAEVGDKKSQPAKLEQGAKRT